jgi:hypothetical protein
VGIAAIALVSAWAPVRGDVQPNIQIFRVQDKYASAHFHSERADPTDPSRTILTDVFVTVFDDEGLSPGTGWAPIPGARVVIEDYYQDGTPLVSVFAFPNDALPLAFTIDRSLGSARLVGSMAGSQYDVPPSTTIAVDLTWNATGPIVRQAGTVHLFNSSPGWRYVYNRNGEVTTRSAEATGIVSIGSFNYTPLPSLAPRDSYDFGNLGDLRGGVQTIGVSRIH